MTRRCSVYRPSPRIDRAQFFLSRVTPARGVHRRRLPPSDIARAGERTTAPRNVEDFHLDRFCDSAVRNDAGVANLNSFQSEDGGTNPRNGPSSATRIRLQTHSSLNARLTEHTGQQDKDLRELRSWQRRLEGELQTLRPIACQHNSLQGRYA